MKKAEYLDNRHLALRIMGKEGFAGVKQDIGDRLNPVRANKIVQLMRQEYGIKNVDADLLELASSKRPGRMGGPVTPPADGEEREYTVGGNGRICVPLNLLGKQPGDKARVRYSRKQIVIRS
jgi:hypothetical protein